MEELNVLSYARFIRYARPLAYSSEVGESLRHTLPKLVTPLYALSFAYVGADLAYDVYKAPQDKRMEVGIKRGIWHGLASILMPAITINRIVWFGNQVFKSNPRCQLYSAVLGLCSIPFVVHPIDHGVDIVCDNYINPQLDRLLHHE